MFLSIIIPIYHTNIDLFDRCIQSLKTQQGVDWGDIEIILINDENDENINEYCQNLVIGDNIQISIQLLHTTIHLGAGRARQYGLDHATGEWIYFMDSDDELYSDMSLCYIIESVKGQLGKKMFTFYHMNEDRGNTVCNYGMASLYGVCFNKAIIDKYDIRFRSLTLYEDIAFVSTYAYMVGWGAIQDCNAFPVYWYHLNNSSVTHGISANGHAQTAFECDLHCIAYINYKMSEFMKYDYSFYIYSLFRLMNETERIMQFGIEEDDTTLMLYTEILFKIKSIIRDVNESQLQSIASEFGKDGDMLMSKVELFLNKNPLIGDVNNAN